MKKNKKLNKSNKNKMIAGVCGGIAEYFNVDPTIVRLIAVVFGLLKGFGFLLYLVAAIVMPYDDKSFMDDDDVENLKSANIDEDEKNQKDEEGESKGKHHSDEEFNSFFEKK